MPRKKTRPAEPAKTQHADQPWLTLTDVARILGEERAIANGQDPATAEPVSRNTVKSYLNRYQPDNPNRQFGDHPMPRPVYPDAARPLRGQHPLWIPGPGKTVADVERGLRAWWHSRVGAGVGGGPKPRVPVQQVPCVCESGAMVAPGTRCDECIRDGVDQHVHIDWRS